MMTRALALASGALMFSACSSINTLTYTPTRLVSTAPAADVATGIIAANVTRGCMVTPRVSAKTLTVRYTCKEGVGEIVAHLDKVKRIELQEEDGWYHVLVHHTDGSEDFRWTGKLLTEIVQLADALTDWSRAGPADGPGSAPR